MSNNFIGQRINYLRKQAGLTMRELGLKVGFGEGTADIRISQYEHGTRLPRLEVLVKIAAALHCEPDTLLYPDCDSIAGMMHLFFYLEERYGFKPYIAPDGTIGITLTPNFNEKTYDCCLSSAVHSWWMATAALEKSLLTENNYHTWKNNYAHANLFTLMPGLKGALKEINSDCPDPAILDSRLWAQVRFDQGEKP